MTGSMPRPPVNPEAPEITLPSVVPAAAGVATGVAVRIHHRGRSPAAMRVTVLGLDSRWIPAPLDLGPLQPGEAAEITLTLVPERGALGARYPFVIAVESTPVRGGAAPVMGIAEATLAVDSQERISMSIQPPTPSAVFGKKFRVQITNPGSRERTFTLVPDAASGASVSLRRDEVQVPAQRTVSVKGKVRIRRPSIAGGESTHTFTVTAQGTGAPEFAEATVRATPLIRRGARVAIGLAVVVALWAGLAIVFIPKISDVFKPEPLVGAPSTVTSQGPVAGTGGGQDGTGGAGGSGGSSGSGGGGSGEGGSGNGGSGNGGSGNGGSGGGSGNGSGATGGAQPAGYQLSGTVTGPGAQGATVTLEPVSLRDASDAGAEAAPGSSTGTVNALRSAAAAPLGKIAGPRAPVAADTDSSAAATNESTAHRTTNAKGEFLFPNISAPGYYLLTVAKAGFQTQRFLINSTDLASPKPVKVALVPGTGGLSGTVTGPDGAPIGAATVTVTDGKVTLQTSSVSASSETGTPGTWTMDQLSTPGSYLVSVTAPGYGGASTLVSLGASQTATADLSLVPGEASIVGTVRGANHRGQVSGLGGITVTATNGKITRTATTVTSPALRGTYILPSMPTPGEYTLTISGDGFLTQTRTVTIAQGVGTATVDATLSRADGTVQGIVTGLAADGSAQGGLVGVGLTLSSGTLTLKTMTTSGGSAGGYRFTGVPPGTYVLTATQYGRTPASATVKVQASDTKTVDLSLVANTGGELPSTAHIRGQVVDSRTGGPLTCDRAAVPVAPADCVATIMISAAADPADPDSRSVSYTVTTTDARDFVYTVPSLDDPDHHGLPPGLYTVTVSAPGYEATTTHVQVAQGQMAPAPQVSLPTLSIISGTVTTRVGTPARPSCVVAVPASVDVPDRLPTECTPNKTGTVCLVPGLGSQQCGLTSQGGEGESAAGTYQVRGLRHGRYQLLVIAQDPEYRYVVSAPPVVELDLGADGQFNAVLDRLGRVQVMVYNANRQSGALSAAGGAAIRITDRATGKTTRAGTTAANGTATVTGLNGTYTVAATLHGTTNTVPSGPVGLNQTVSLTMVIAAPVGPIVGRVTTNNGLSSHPVPVAGAVVTVSGTTGYNGSTPVSGSTDVTTDAHGCYAIVPAGWDAATSPDLTTPDCPNPVVTAASIQTMTAVAPDGSTAPATLQSDRIGVAVQAVGTRTESYPVTSTVITGTKQVRVIPSISVRPQPVSVSPLMLAVSGPASGYTVPDLSTAVIDVLSKPGLAGGVTITAPATTPVQATGKSAAVPLSFADTTLAAPNGMPGRYALRVSLPNFVTLRADLLCEMGGTCTIVQPGTSVPMPDGLLLKQMPSITGVIHAAALPGAGPVSERAPDWSSAVLNQVSGPTQVGNMDVVAGPIDPASGVPVGIVQFDGADSVLAAPGGRYVFGLQMPGFAPENNIVVTCGADYSADPAPTGCTPLHPSGGGLDQLPTFAGSVALSAPPGVTVAVRSATVTAVDTVNPSNTIRVQVNADGTLTWRDSPQPENLVAVGSYELTASAPGFAPVTVPFDCRGGAATCGPAGGIVRLTMAPQISGTISLGGDVAGAALDDVTITPTSYPTTAGSITVDVDADGQVHFTDASMPEAGTNGLPGGLALPGSYAFTVALDGYQQEKVTVRCGPDYTWSGDDNMSGSVDPVHGCQPLSTKLIPLPEFSGTVALSSTTYPYDDSHNILVGDVTATVTPNPGSSIKVTVSDDGNDDGTGIAHWSDSRTGILDGQVRPGNYTITYSLPGFQNAQATLDCSDTDATCTQSPAEVHLHMLPVARGAVTIAVPDGQSVNLRGAHITPTAAQNPAHAADLTVSLPRTVTDSDADGTVTANLQWFDSGLPFPGIVHPDKYTLDIEVPGYQPLTVDVDCTSAGDTCTPDPAEPTLIRNPRPDLKLTVLPESVPVPSLLVTGGPTGDGTVRLTSDEQGNLTWQQQGQPAGAITAGDQPYTITIGMSGYVMVVNGDVDTDKSVEFTCTTDSCDFPDIALIAPTTLTVKLVDANSNAAGVADLTLTRTRDGDTRTIDTPTTTNGSVDFGSVATDAANLTGGTPITDDSYSLTVHAAGFAFADDLSDSSTLTVECVHNGQDRVDGLRLFPGGTTVCTVTLTRLATITAQTVWDIMPLNPDGKDLDFHDRIASNDLPSVTITACNGINETSGTDIVACDDSDAVNASFKGTSDSHGRLAITGGTKTAGLTSGTWTLSADVDGYQPISGTIVINSDNTIDSGSLTGPFELITQDADGNALDTPVLRIHFTPTAVDLQVHLQTDGADVLPSATVTLTDEAPDPGPYHLSCDTTDDPAPDCVEDNHVTFTDVPPGTYHVTVDFPDSSDYTDIPDTTVVVKRTSEPGSGDVQQVPPFNLSAKVTTLTGGLVDSNGDPLVIDGHAELWPWGGSKPADDANGDPLEVDVHNGVFAFYQIKDGYYQVVVTADGYGTGKSGIVAIAYGTNPESPEVTMPVATRKVQLTITSPVSEADLSGATVTLTPVAGTSDHVPENVVQSNIALTGEGPWTATIPQLPTGQWTVTVVGQTGAPFPSPAIEDLSSPDADTITVPESTDNEDPQPFSDTLHLNQATATFTVNWDDVACAVPPTAGSTITLTVAPDGTSAGNDVPITVNQAADAATGTAILPPGKYDWNVETALDGWKPPSTDRTVTIPDTAEDKTTSGSLTAVTVTVTASLTIDGTDASQDYDDTHVTPTCNNTEAPGKDLVNGSTEFDLAPGEWTFGIKGTEQHPVVFPDSVPLTVTADGPNTVPFVGVSVQPTVDLAEPIVDTDTGGIVDSDDTDDTDNTVQRPADTKEREITATLYRGADDSGTKVWSTPDDAEIAGSDGTYTGPTIIVPAPDTGTTQSYYLAAETSDSDDVFGSGNASTSIDGTETDVTPMTASLAYTAAMLDVTVSDAPTGTGVTSTFTLSAENADGTDSTEVTDPVSVQSGSTITYFDLTPNTSYQVNATYAEPSGDDDNDNEYAGEVTQSTGAAGTVATGTLSVSAETTSVSLLVKTSDGDPASSTTVSLTLGGQAPGAGSPSGTTDDDGAVTIGGLTPSTTYTVHATVTVDGTTYSVADPATVTSPTSGTGDQTTITLSEPTEP